MSDAIKTGDAHASKNEKKKCLELFDLARKLSNKSFQKKGRREVGEEGGRGECRKGRQSIIWPGSRGHYSLL